MAACLCGAGRRRLPTFQTAKSHRLLGEMRLKAGAFYHKLPHFHTTTVTLATPLQPRRQSLALDCQPSAGMENLFTEEEKVA